VRTEVAVLRELGGFAAPQFVEKNHYHQSSSPIVDSTAFAASLAQHLTIIFLIDNHGSAWSGPR
jgi:hypothetical protein